MSSSLDSSGMKSNMPLSSSTLFHSKEVPRDLEIQANTIAVSCDHEREIHAQYPSSRWQRFRSIIREPMAEFIGVALLVIFGAGSACQVVLSTNPNIASSTKGDFLSINFGWAIGIAMGVWVSGGISGGHINPAITVALATWRAFPWRKVPVYIFAQVMGGLVGAALVYGLYFRAIDIFEGHGIRTQATAGIFSTFALPYMTSVACFFTEFLATAILSLVVLAATDKHKMAPPTGLLPLTLFILFLGFGTSLGMQTAYALNPARDLGPRLFLSMAGYGKAVYTYRNHYWIWCPILAPLAGAQAGAFLYDAFLFDGQSLFDRRAL